MINSIKLDKYRGFDSYTLGGLARVNLLVGKNNCGKTSVLEAAHLLATGGDPRVFVGIGWQRGEVILFDSRESARRMPANAYFPTSERIYTDISHFFYGHSFNIDSRFALSSNNSVGSISVGVEELLISRQERRQPMLFEDVDARAAFSVMVNRRIGMENQTVHAIPVTKEGGVYIEYVYRFKRNEDGPPVQFITADSLERHSMSEMWNRVITEGREADVVRAMKILAPDLNGIFFLTTERNYGYEGRAGILIGFENSSARVPLGSYGEGMRRILALSLSLARTKGGVLLVDEIDTGLHYSIMGEMWRLVVEAARLHNIQVFATTHSLDCIRGLAWLYDNHPSLRGEFALHKIDRNLDESIPLSSKDVQTVVDQGIEPR